jgi:integrase
MRKVLTEAVVRGAKPPETGQYDVWDARHPGFGLRVSYGGAKTFVLLYRQNGIKHRLTLGKWPAMSLADAHRAARKRGGEIADGKDPAGERTAAKLAPTFGDLANEYLERHARPNKTARSVVEDIRMLNADLLPEWKDRKLADITRHDVRNVLEAITDRGAPIHANRVRALVSKMFNFGIDRDYIEQNPAYRISGRNKETKRDRVLTSDELHRLWGALESESTRVGAAFKLLLLTAARRGEVLGMSWAELDLDNGWWTIAADRAKNGLSHRVPLSSSALALLHTLKNDAEFVFLGGRRGRPLANPQKWILRLRDRAAIPDFRFHDLRRTVASSMTGSGVPRLVVSKLLNHAEAGVTSIYDRHSYDAEKRTAVERWERALLAIIGEARRGNVFALAARVAGS